MPHDGKIPARNPISAPSTSLPMPEYEYQEQENGFGSASAPAYGEPRPQGNEGGEQKQVEGIETGLEVE